MMAGDEARGESESAFFSRAFTHSAGQFSELLDCGEKRE
jgi:hypothetical protein